MGKLIEIKTEHIGAIRSLFELLKDVLEDYLIYYNDIKNEKGKQYNALMKTLEHVDTITASEEHTRNNIKFDQREILNEMKKIKREMQVLTPTKK